MASSTAETTPVIFTFHHEGRVPANDFHVTYPFPSNLVRPNARDQPNYQNLFPSALEPILHKHYQQNIQACSKQCMNCGGPTSRVFQMPTDTQLRGTPPTVVMMCLPLCGDVRCANAAQIGTGTYLEDENERIARAERGVCQKCEAERREGVVLSQCSRCRKIVYCSKECQKRDWRRHKPYCGKSVPEMRKT